MVGAILRLQSLSVLGVVIRHHVGLMLTPTPVQHQECFRGGRRSSQQKAAAAAKEPWVIVKGSESRNTASWHQVTHFWGGR
jgi:hypothetical protein